MRDKTAIRLNKNKNCWAHGRYFHPSQWGKSEKLEGFSLCIKSFFSQVSWRQCKQAPSGAFSSLHPHSAEPHVRNTSPRSSLPSKVKCHMANILLLSRAVLLSSLSTRIFLRNKSNIFLISQIFQWQNPTLMLLW